MVQLVFFPNYGPVSVLSHASRIFEKIPFNQMNLFFEAKFWIWLEAKFWTTFNQILQESQHKNILLDMI